MIYNGATLVLVETREDFTPEQGFVVVERYSGTDVALQLKARDVQLAGYVTRWTKTEGVTSLEVVIPEPGRNPDGTADEQVSDDWQIDTQFTQVEVWADEGLRKYLFDNAIPQGAPNMTVVDAAISTYRATIDDHLQKFYKPDGTRDTARSGPTPKQNFKPKYHDGCAITETAELNFLTVFYDQIVKGVDKSRAARVSLSRRRTIKADSAQRFVVTNVNEAWTPAAFYAEFDVPGPIQDLLPSAPTANDTPPGTTWAWALFAQEAQTSGTGLRVQERLEWIFAPVRNFTFTIHTTPP